MPSAEIHLRTLVPLDERILRIPPARERSHLAIAEEGLKGDRVILFEALSLTEAEEMVAAVATQAGLLDQLELQAAFASIHGHRKNIGNFFMTVTQREHGQFITPHSEGTRLANIQLASFYCIENSTDGGETILLNTRQNGGGWRTQRELVFKIDAEAASQLSAAQIQYAKVLYNIQLPRDTLSDVDHVVLETSSEELCGLKVYGVLIPLAMAHSQVLDQDMYVYWDNVGNVDYDSVEQYANLLGQIGLPGLPLNLTRLAEIDKYRDRRCWRSGSHYTDFFSGYIRHKLRPGDLLIFNNLSWAHSATAWTPQAGNRRVIAAFA